MSRHRKSETVERASDGRRLYSNGDVTAFTGAKRSQVEYWTKADVIRADYETAGTGNHRGFSFRNLVEFAVSVQLWKIGASLETMRRATDLGLRLLDPADDRFNMPGMQKHLPPKASPAQQAKLEAEFRAHGRKRELKLKAALGPELYAATAATFAREQADWQAFKNPKTRTSSSESPVLCVHEWPSIVWPSRSTDALVPVDGPIIVVPLGRIICNLEASTGDHWDNVDTKHP